VTPRVEVFHRRAQGSEPVRLATPEQIDALIDELLTGSEYENMAALYSLERRKLPSGAADHQLLIGVDRELRIGLVSYFDADGNRITVGPPDGRDEVVYYSCGEITEFPGPSEVSIELVRQAAKEFLTSGGQRPTCVQWQVPAY
jgi:hypothetical protein